MVASLERGGGGWWEWKRRGKRSSPEEEERKGNELADLKEGGLNGAAVFERAKRRKGEKVSQGAWKDDDREVQEGLRWVYRIRQNEAGKPQKKWIGKSELLPPRGRRRSLPALSSRHGR